VTAPGGSDWWTKGDWQKPDLAFITPWKGLSCSDAQGKSRSDYSPEITFNTPGVPPAPDKQVDSVIAGNLVKVKAIVHNYSTNSVSGVPIKFYKGDPASGGQQIICNTPQPDIDVGPRGKAEVSCTFTAASIGDQRIYVVADPASQVTEHFKNNNKGYNVLTVMGDNSASGIDPGLIAEKQGKLFELGLDSGELISVFIPYAVFQKNDVTNYDNMVTNLKVDPAPMPGLVFQVSNMQVDGTNAAWVNTKMNFGVNDIIVHDYNIPPVAVTIKYLDSDVRPIFFNEANLRLYHWTGIAWKDETDKCGALMVDAVNNMATVPVCSTGTYLLASPVMSEYIPILKK